METNYQQQAEDFLKNTNSELTITFDKFDYHFIGDKEKRDIYNVTLKRGNREYAFKFGNSINNSQFKIVARYFNREELKNCLENGKVNKYKFANNFFTLTLDESNKIQYPKAPDAYDILACLTKYDPDTFENFCSEYGYDEDSRKAEKTYNAVKDEYLHLCMLYSPEEMELLQEIW